MPGQPDEDAQLLKKARKGEADAFGYLYEEHATAIFRYLYVHLGNHPDAEDLTSEVFLRAWQALPHYNQRGVPFRAFLFRIAHNALVDHYRHARTQSSLALEQKVRSTVEDPDPEDILVQKIDQQELTGVLSKIRDDYRTVLALRFISQLSPAETALVMQRSSGAVRVLQHRALEAVRQIIEADTSDKV